MALDPNKITLCWPNYVDTSTLSGGGYVATLPLANAQDRRFAAVAKTASLDPLDTQFDLTLIDARPVRVVALAAHNMTASARYRVRLYADSGQLDMLWDSGEQDVWPALYTSEQLEWEYENFWGGTLDEKEREYFTPLLTVLVDDVQMAVSAKIELFDSSNPSGAITLGRAFISDAWQPAYNASYGLQDGHDTGTEITQAGDPARTEYARRVTPKRTVSFDLAHLDERESFLRLHRLRRTQDIVGEVLYLFSTQPSPSNFSRTFIARQQSLDAISHPYHRTFDTTVNLLEIL